MHGGEHEHPLSAALDAFAEPRLDPAREPFVQHARRPPQPIALLARDSARRNVRRFVREHREHLAVEVHLNPS